ncbi:MULTISPECIES: phosphodiester glycosidase family protein [Niastella]|uniref:Phosphodiester glycosidase family protein n=1 Tax=Niastella soli TaxID=2821487 RepID=A0ABS3YXC3_9BACT|nr:phosphodiester glycosidase family protein [Niastella soli]MBO9202580.1 phosphodiester glycosidase family protein [Niastella soli]
MKHIIYLLLTLLPINLLAQDKIIDYIVNDPQRIHFYYKNEKGVKFNTIQSLKEWLQSKKQHLLFATNGGMFTPEYTPVGLYIENFKMIKGVNHVKGGGNFGLKPNGIFFLTANNEAKICKTEDFKDNGKVKYATQSGPMLVIANEIHPAFNKNSSNLNIRSGVGILPNGSVLFAISNEAVTLYEFAMYFKQKGCRNALYLDGAISEMYCPDKGLNQIGGSFGVMIGLTEK